MKKNSDVLFVVVMLLMTMVPWSARTTVYFSDDFTTGSTLNEVSNPNGGATSYDMAATKNCVGAVAINPGDFTIKLNSATQTGWVEAQALFTNSPVALNHSGDYIDITMVITNAGGILPANILFNGPNSLLHLGLFYSGGSKPLAGDLANAGLTTAPDSIYAAGNCANWQGYVAQMSSNGVSRIVTRPPQNGGGTTSANQDLVADNNGSGSYVNPPGTVLGTASPAPIVLVAGSVYTVYFRITLVGSTSLSLSNAIYAGTGTGGSLVFAQIGNVDAIGAPYWITAFDGFAIGLYSKPPSGQANALLDIASIQVSGRTYTPPYFTLAPVLVATNGTGAFSVTAMGIGLSYQWHRNGTNITTGGNLTVMTSPDGSRSTLVISPAGLADAATGSNGYWVTVTGPGFFSANSTTNDLILKPATNLVWTAAAGTIWDVNTTASWRDTNGVTQAFNYGDPVTFDDSATNAVVNVSAPFLSPASVTVNNSVPYVFQGSGSIAGPCTVLIRGEGWLTINEANAHTGGTIISNAGPAVTLLQNLGGLGAGPVTLASPGTLEIANGSSTSVGINGNVVVNEDFTFQLDGSNSFAAVFFGDWSGLPGKTLTMEPRDFGSPHRVRVYGTNVSYDADLFLDGQATNEAMYFGTVLAPYNPAGCQTYNGVISGYGGIVQRGSGTTILAGQNTYSGGTTPTAGAIGLGIDSIGSPTVTSGPIGTGPLFIAPEVNNVNGVGAVFASGGARTIANLLQYPSGTNNQTLTIGGCNNLTFSGTMALNGLDGLGDPTNRILNVTNLGVTTISGVISDSGLGYGLTKKGGGILVLSDTETYSGSTVVNGGTLAVNGQIGPGAVTVAGGTLGGTGAITGTVTVQTNGCLAPGNSIGILTVNNDLTLAGNMFIEVDTSAGQNCDKLIVSGALTNAGMGVVTVTNRGPALAPGDTFFLFNKPMSNAAALNITGSLAHWTNKLAIDGSVAVLSLIPVTGTNLTATLNGNIMSLTWPDIYAGWSLQSNSVSITSTNWVDVPNSSGSSSMSITVNPTNRNVFYRMFLIH